MMRNFICIPFIFLPLILTSCGSGGGSGTKNSIDAVDAGSCTAYSDSGYSNGMRIGSGQMPSDISLSPISACSEGQFIFNGKCWNSIQYDDANGEVDFIDAKQTQVILNPFQQFSEVMQNEMFSIQNLTNKIDCVSNPQFDIYSKYCTIDYQMYYDFVDYTASSVWALQQWGWGHTQTSSNSYGFQYATGESIISLKTMFGICGNKSIYDWYNNGNMKLNSHSFHLPLSSSKFLTVYPNSEKVSCPYSRNGWVCYSVSTTWGSQSFYFDENGNLNSLKLNYIDNS
jgi:hypothetical protein